MTDPNTELSNGEAHADATPFVPTRLITTTTLEGPPVAEAEPVSPAPGTENADTSAATGIGIDGEQTVWEARYSMRNFLGRIVFRAILTAAWGVLAFYTWAEGYDNFSVVTWVLGAVIVVLWLVLGLRILQARYGHHYRLTNRRLFVATGLMRRRSDQMELLRVKDVFTRQTLLQQWMSLGTVVAVSHEKDLPVFYLTGVDDPKRVMDLIWHHARTERDNRTTKIDSV